MAPRRPADAAGGSVRLDSTPHSASKIPLHQLGKSLFTRLFLFSSNAGSVGGPAERRGTRARRPFFFGRECQLSARRVFCEVRGFAEVFDGCWEIASENPPIVSTTKCSVGKGRGAPGDKTGRPSSLFFAERCTMLD